MAPKLIRLLLSICNDLKFSKQILRGVIPSKFSQFGYFATANSDYTAINDCIKFIPKNAKSFIDIGCGKGRVLAAVNAQVPWLEKIIGIEIDPDVANETSIRLARFSKITVVTDDIFKSDMPIVDIYYLFNPFDSSCWQKFIDKLGKSLIIHNKHATIIYYNCKYLSDGSTDLFEVKYYPPESSLFLGKHPVAILKFFPNSQNSQPF